MEQVAISNFTKRKLDISYFEQIAKFVLKGEKEIKREVSIIFVGKKRIRDLNKKYRKKDYVADVLSFAQDKDFDFIGPETDMLGEVVICLAKVESNAKKKGKAFYEELALILIHGILHLLGYDHELLEKDAKIMERKQNYYLDLALDFKSK